MLVRQALVPLHCVARKCNQVRGRQVERWCTTVWQTGDFDQLVHKSRDLESACLNL